MVPDKLPESHKEPTAEMRRARALRSVQTNLIAAVNRLDAFLRDKAPEEVLRRVHTAKTEVRNDADDPEIVTYYSLWTDFSDMRLTQSGQLLRSNYYDEKYSDVRKYGVDQSKIVGLYELRSESKYKTAHLLSLANQLERFLRPQDELNA